MRRQDAIVLTACAGVVVTSALYVAIPRGPVYYPIEHTWRWDQVPGIAMRWYGRSGTAFAGGALAMLLAWPLCRRLGSRWNAGPPTWLPPLAAAVTLVTLALALGYTVVHEWRDWMMR